LRSSAPARAPAASPVKVAEQHAHEQQDVAEVIVSGAAALPRCRSIARHLHDLAGAGTLQTVSRPGLVTRRRSR
jgi:hypothetical protein